MDHAEDEEIVDAVKRVTGASTAKITKEPSLFWPKVVHRMGVHTRRMSYEYDIDTSSLRFLGSVCVVCRK